MQNQYLKIILLIFIIRLISGCGLTRGPILNQNDIQCEALKKQECDKTSACLWNLDTCISKWHTELPAIPEGIKKVKQIKADNYVCVIDKNDELWCLSRFAHLEISPHNSRKFVEIETQSWRVCGVLIDGNGICFTNGKEDKGLSFSQKLSKLYPFGKHTCGIYVDGTVFCDSDNLNISTISVNNRDPIKVTHLVVNDDYYLGAMYEDGQFDGLRFSSNKWEKLAIMHGLATASTAASQITTTLLPDSCVISKGTQKLTCIGLHYSKKEILIPTEIDTEAFEAISVGYNHTCGILVKDNEARCWGGKSKGQIELSKKITDVKSIVAGKDISCYINSSDELHCIGQGYGT